MHLVYYTSWQVLSGFTVPPAAGDGHAELVVPWELPCCIPSSAGVWNLLARTQQNYNC